MKLASFQRIHFLIIIFLTGACTLIIELVATRILAPYFGNTIYTLSGVISVILASLAFGYSRGGKLSDAHPSVRLFYIIIAGSGCSVFLLFCLSAFVVPFIANKLSIVYGPLFISCILFFFPAFMLGMLSPFAIKLSKAACPNFGIGKISGDVFFFSTLGSIFGTLITSFVLIPRFGTNSILLFCGIFLFLLGIGPLFRLGISKKYLFFFIFFFFGAMLVFQYFIHLFSWNRNTFAFDGMYQYVQIVDAQYNNRPTRFLVLDKALAGAMYLDQPKELVFPYTRSYQLKRLLNSDITTACALGGGTYSVPKALLHEFPTLRMDVVEIDPLISSLAQKYFSVNLNSRITNYTNDGRAFLRQTDSSYDLIFSDMFSSYLSLPIHTTTKEFFELVRSKLNPSGIYILNVAGNLSTQKPSFLYSEMRTFRSAFTYNAFFSIDSFSSNDPQNILFIGIASNTTKDIESIMNESELSRLQLKQLHVSDAELMNYPLLTDDYAPVEYLNSRFIRDYSRSL